jgi:hypothetical protein
MTLKHRFACAALPSLAALAYSASCRQETRRKVRAQAKAGSAPGAGSRSYVEVVPDFCTGR